MKAKTHEHGDANIGSMRGVEDTARESCAPTARQQA
jgi:hypothetical protein